MNTLFSIVISAQFYMNTVLKGVINGIKVMKRMTYGFRNSDNFILKI